MRVLPNLLADFAKSSRKFPYSHALHTDGRYWSYGELCSYAGKVGGWLSDRGVAANDRVVLLGAKGIGMYAAMLGAAWIGATYVPLSSDFPPIYLKKLAKRIAPAAIIRDPSGLATDLDETTATSPIPLLDISTERDIEALHETVAGPVSTPPTSLVHIMFTSGSTGEPKMIGTTLANANAYLNACRMRYQPRADDRFSHYNELGWDPYLFDLFGAWQAGACSYAVPKAQRISPASFIMEHELTIWYSVPSVIHFMRRLHHLGPGSLGSLRLSKFVGEPLELTAVEAWRRAAPNSQIENVYGPTECTVVCTGHRFDATNPKTTPGRSYLPVGAPYEGSIIEIVGDTLTPLPRGEKGQIAIGGPQVAPGYINDEENSSQSFVKIGQEDENWYLTGDLGMVDEEGELHFLGRMDHQLKVLGNRVEPEAVEAALLEIEGVHEAVIVPGPTRDGIVQWLNAAAVTELAPLHIIKEAKRKLPAYMVPKKVLTLPTLPRNKNGKSDRKAIGQLFKKS